MPPKTKITKESIVNVAVGIVRQSGADALNARAVAALLNCSTQPIFSNFATMDELLWAVIADAYALYSSYLRREVERGEYPQYKSFGMAYVRFASEEKNLFKLLFMRDRSGEDLSPSPDFEKSVKIIMEANQVSEDTASLMHLETWAVVHGIATMQATSFLSLDEGLVSTMLTDVHLGLRARFSEKEVKA